MSNPDKQVQDQAHLLRNMVEETQHSQNDAVHSSNFPPRSTVHKNKTTQFKWKMKYPIVRLLLIFFILLPIILLSIHYYRSDGENKSTAVIDTNEHGFENVELDIGNSKDILNADLYENHQPSTSVDNEEMTKDYQEHTSIVANQDLSKQKETHDQQVVEKKESTISDTQQSGTKNGAEYVVKYHKVKANETLFSISKEYYHNKNGVQSIQKWNHLKGIDIFVGQTLKIPIKK
jgi:LysM repeat protein